MRGNGLTAAKGIQHNEYFKTIVAVVLVIVVVFGLFFGLRAALNTSDPALTVVSGSMSIPYDAADYNFWLTIATPFDRTLSVGDIIIVQGVNPKDLNTNYPNSDIIVFHEPGDYNTLIVHRIVSAKTVDGTLYFITKGDGNGNNNPWPETPTSGLDTWDSNNGVPASDVVGKVIMRIPWFGWVTIFVHDNQWGLPVIILLIMVIAIIEFVLPMLREKKPQQDNQNHPPPQNPPDSSTSFSQLFLHF
jgi:signal peptidase I